MLTRRTILYHAFFWTGIYLLWVFLFRNYSLSVTKTMTIEFCYLLFITADYYAVNHLIIPRFLHHKKYLLFISAITMIIAFSAWLRALLAVQMNLHVFHPAHAIGFGSLYLNSVINIMTWVLLITTGKVVVDRVQAQRQLEILEKERIKNELDYLKAQINPHALFNSLNTVYGHIDKTNPAARNILLQFSGLLRYQLYDCSAEKVGLENELDYIKNYVAFQRLRKDEKLWVDLELDHNKTGMQIAPLLLVVLIENAFKFVSNSSDKENRIGIKISTAGNRLHSVVSNTIERPANMVNENCNGIGLVNLKRRLALLYPGKHDLTVYSNNDFYEASLMIDLS